MVLRKNNKSLTKTEISIIKRLHNDGMNNQEILGIINSKKANTSLHINPGRISEVIKNKKVRMFCPQTKMSLNYF